MIWNGKLEKNSMLRFEFVQQKAAVYYHHAPFAHYDDL